MIADDGGAPDGVPDKHGAEHKVHVHDHPVGSHPVLPRQGHELVIVQHRHQRHGDVGHQLRGAVGAGLHKNPRVKPGLCQPQKALVLSQKIHQGNSPAHHLAEACGQGRPRQPPPEHCDEHIVQNHVGQPRRHGDCQAQLRLLRGDEKTLEHVLQHEKCLEHQHNPPVDDAVLQHLPAGSQNPGHRPEPCEAHRRQRQPKPYGHIDQHGKILVCLLLLSFPQRHGHHGAPAGSHHESQPAQDHQEGVYEIQGREGRLAHVVGHEQPIHHAVDGGEHHHDHRRHDKSQKPLPCEMIRQADLCLLFIYSS